MAYFCPLDKVDTSVPYTNSNIEQRIRYGLQDPRNNAIFYVGMTADVYRRFISHLKCEGTNEEKNKRIDEMKAQGFVPVLVTLETAHIQEMSFIRKNVRFLRERATLPSAFSESAFSHNLA